MNTATAVTVIRTIVLTLRQLATWCIDGRSEMTDDELRALAVQVEQIEPGWCCPMCEEATCDAGCPLEPVRADDSAALRQLIIDGLVTDAKIVPPGPPPSAAGSDASPVVPRAV